MHGGDIRVVPTQVVNYNYIEYRDIIFKRNHELMKKKNSSQRGDNSWKCKNIGSNNNAYEMSEWLLFNAISAIFQLFHGENKLIFTEMMMRSSLY